MDVDEKQAIYFATKALSGKDVPTPKKREQPSKGGKTSVQAKKKISQNTTKKT